jgi:hypothetical protein
LRGVGRAEDLAVVLRTLLRSIQAGPGGVILRGELWGPAVVLLLEPAETAHNLHPAADWTIVPADRPGPELGVDRGEEALDRYVAARLMGEQGGDIWTTAHTGGQVSFAIRLPAARPTTEEVNA